MNRAERRASKHSKPINIVLQKNMSFIQIDVYVRPLEDFIDEIERGEVNVDQFGHALINLPNNHIMDRINKGKHPLRAVDNIASILESYFQVTAYCFSDADLERVSDEINRFNRRILKPLMLNSPIQKEAIAEARELCKNIRSALKKAPAIKVAYVSEQIALAIERAIAKGDKQVDPDDLRVWLIEWAKQVAPSKIG
jgi:hypothetical protein